MKENITETHKFIEFTLNTIYSIPRIYNWLSAGLQKIREETDNYFMYGFSEIKADDENMHYTLASKLYRIDLFSQDEYKLLIRPIKLEKCTEESTNENLIKLSKNIFEIINKHVSFEDRKKKGRFEPFFFKNIRLASIFKIEKPDSQFKIESTTFEDINIFDKPFAAEYPEMFQTKSKFEATLESDFLNNLRMGLMFERDYDKEEKKSFVTASVVYDGRVADKDYPLDEQIFLVEDATKELLARAWTLKRELEIKINGE